MKKSILIAAFGLAACVADAQQVLTVIEQDYELAKRTAAQEQKLLIVDFYTTWCVPCKVLDKTIFKNDSIAGQISRNFVVLRYDAEQDSVYNLSLKHHIASYPTTAVLTADGRLIQKMFGTGGSKSLVANYTDLLSKCISLNKEGKYIAGYGADIDPDAYPDFYKKYVRRIADIKPGDLANYWAKNKELQSEVSFAILAYFGRAPEHVVDFFIAHKPEYERLFGEADVKFVINNITAEKFSRAVATKDTARYEAATKFARQQLAASEAERYLAVYELEMYMAMQKWDKAAGIIAARIQQQAIDENGINQFCWNVYERCNETKIIDRAIQFMKAVTDRHPSYALLDTYARLLAKNGNKAAAITAMKQAIEAGKANGEDTKESEEALSKL